MLDPADPIERLAAAQARYRRARARLVCWTITGVLVLMLAMTYSVRVAGLPWPVSAASIVGGVASGLLWSRRRRWRRSPRAIGFLLMLCLGACAAPVDTVDNAARTAGRPQPRVAEPDPGRSSYDRDQWEPHGWLDADGDGCNTRAEVLMSESTVATRHRTGSCTVVSGRWVDPYTGRVIFDAAQVQIDHLVSLSDAHASGGWAWPADRKAAFANDLTEEWALNATWGAENQRKADLGPDRWMPPEASFGCTYVSAYARIKARWGLTVTPTQWHAVETTWWGCGK